MSAQSSVRDLLRQHGPLTLDQLVQLATESRAVVSKAPKQTIRNALRSEPSVEPGGDDRYVYFPQFVMGARVHVPVDLAAPDRQLLAIGPDASALLWPADASGTEGPTPKIALENGPNVRAKSPYRWAGNLRTVVQLPAEFWRWWAEQEGADALLLSCVDGEAGCFAARAVQANSVDQEEVAARNAQVLQAAGEIMRRSQSLQVGDVARRLLARGIYHHDPPPDPLLQTLLVPGAPFVRDRSGIAYRPDITPAMWRLFQPRMTEDLAVEEALPLRALGLSPEGDGADTEEEPQWPEPPPLPEKAAQQGYRLRVKLRWRPGVWRDLEMRGDQSLEELHLAIQDAFNWDNDHLYAFYLSGKRFDLLTEVGAPTDFGEERPPLSDEVALAHLELQRGQKFLYLFDFGDELLHDVEVVGTFTSDEGVTYPRIVESHGDAPPQYPNWDEWDGESEGDEEDGDED